ncbi:MAG TPA: carboxypeptidase-like regulatory domain-containing protein [Candidatus Binatia bacterium]|nr:carboxypeptidase-like regulatory domain-containing protein [Candidatus Binatia bacterium]
MRTSWRAIAGAVVVLLAFAGMAAAQKDADNEGIASLSFVVVKEDNGKPIRNAAVIMHPVSSDGKQSRGGLELKTDVDGKASFDDVPYGKLRVQVLASGFQTFGEDYDIRQQKISLTIKLKRPQNQYSIYEGHPEEKKAPPPPPASDSGKPQ